MSLERRKLEEKLNSWYQDALNRFQQNPSNDTKQEVEKLKSELEALYEQKVEGIIVRSRARWHEHGEKNSKYFLNLEKRNHIYQWYKFNGPFSNNGRSKVVLR